MFHELHKARKLISNKSTMFSYSRLNLGNSEILQKKYASIKMINPVFCGKSKVIGPFRIYRTWFSCKKFKTDTKKIPDQLTKSILTSLSPTN